MSLNQACEFYQSANVELEFDGFDHADPEAVTEALSTNWERFGSARNSQAQRLVSGSVGRLVASGVW